MYILTGFEQTRELFNRWMISLPLAQKIALSVGMACLIGVSAQIKFYLPWTPVPVTFQTFTILAAAVLMGGVWGCISTTLYVLAGAAGMPWFSGFAGGFNVLLGPAGGYICGFILASFFAGKYVDRYVKTGNIVRLVLIMFVAVFIFIYIPGLVQLNFWYQFVVGEAPSMVNLIMLGAAPFVVGDLLKITGVVIVSYLMMPKR